MHPAREDVLDQALDRRLVNRTISLERRGERRQHAAKVLDFEHLVKG